MNFPGRLIAGLLVVILLLIFPLQYIAGSNNENIDSLVDGRTKMLTDTIRDKGCLDKQMYESYVEYLDTTGERYDIEIQDIHPVTGEEIGDIGVNDTLMPASTNKNISASLMSTKEIQPFATHTHTNACYPGDLHVCDNINCEYNSDIIYLGLAKSSDSTRGIYYSTDCSSWTRTNSIAANSIMFGNGRFVASYSTGTAVSTDGINWQTKSGLIDGIWYSFYDVTFVNGYFYVSVKRQNSSNYFVFKSVDGINWNKVDGQNKYGYDPIRGLGAGGSTYLWIIMDERQYCYKVNDDGSLTFVNSERKEFDSVDKVMQMGDSIFIYGEVKGGSLSDVGAAIIGSRTSFSSFYSMQDYDGVASDGEEYIGVVADDGGYNYYSGFYKKEYSSSSWYRMRSERLGTNDFTMINGLFHNGKDYILIGNEKTDPRYPSGVYKYSSIYRIYYKEPDCLGNELIGTTPIQFKYITYNADGGYGEVDRGPCIKKEKYYDDRGNEVVPICNQVVTSISATPTTQTVDKGKSISLTVRATYLDGHSGTITNYTTNYNSNKVGSQTVTITYSGLVGNAKTNGTRTCTIKVRVKETNIPSYLTVVPSAMTVYNGNEPTYAVSVTYTSGVTKSLTSSQYSKTGWSSGAGTKNLTFSYTENGKTVSKKVIITVLPWLSNITVTPSPCEIERYDNPVFTVRANFANGSSQLVTGYTMSGLDNTRIGTQTVTITYKHTNNETKSATLRVTVTALKKECPRCHEIYTLNPDDTDPGCPYCVSTIIGIDVVPDYVEVTKGMSLPIKVMAIYKNGTSAQVSAWTSNYNPNRLGIQMVTVEYRGYAKEITVWVEDEMNTCPICNTQYPKSEDRCPVCAEKVISISASPKEITVMQYETISLAVTAHFADGSSRIVDGWSIDTSTVNHGTFTATIGYKGAIDTITLNVLSLTSIECPICNTIYDLIENPSGCPVCSKELVGIEAYLTSGTNLVQLGTTPSIVVVLIFCDEHREFATDGYTLDNYNPSVLGIQTVTVRYKEFTTTIVIEVVNILDNITCPKGHVYHKNSDGTDPGCPFCHREEDIGNIIYFDITYTSEILDSIYSIGAYHFSEGNYITVIVTKKDKSLLYKLQDTFFRTSLLGRKRRYIYGGEVY